MSLVKIISNVGSSSSSLNPDIQVARSSDILISRYNSYSMWCSRQNVSNPEAHAFQSLEVCFEVRKSKANFVTKVGSSSTNFGTWQPALEKFCKSCVKLTVNDCSNLIIWLYMNSNRLKLYQSCHMKSKQIFAHRSLFGMELLCQLEELYHLFPWQEPGEQIHF